MDQNRGGFPRFPNAGDNTPVTGATTPVTSNGAPWDFTASGQLSASAATVWNEIQDNPKKLLETAFRHLAFQINGLGSVLQVLLNSGQDFTFRPVSKSQNGKYWILAIDAHTLQIFNVRNAFVDIKGSEIYFQLKGGNNAVLTIGARTVVRPAANQRQVNFLLEGFLETLVDHFKLQYGVAGCTTDRDVAAICNNPNSPAGSANIPLRRLKSNDPAYADGRSSPSGPRNISPRLISNICGAQGTTADDASNKLKLTDIFVFFGQFLDHDVGISPVGAFAEGRQPLFTVSNELFTERMPIPVPRDDPVFTGPNRKEFLPFERTVFQRIAGVDVTPRRPLNSITSFLDLGQVYGSEAVRRKALRSFQDGKLKTSNGNFLPFNGAGAGGVGISLENAPNAQSRFYVAGDIRACENANLAALHAIFLREHNLVADEIKRSLGISDDETLFRYARDVVIAEYQSIIYSEWLPLLLGGDAPNPQSFRYNPNVDASMDAFFTTVSFRFGHTMVNNFLWRVGRGGTTPYSRVPLRDVFFEPEVITPATIDDFVRGMCLHQCRDVDMKVVDDLRNFLFTEGGPSMDLMSLNIQRGRDMGLPSYNGARAAFGLPAHTSFAQITKNAQEQGKLSRAYNGNVNIVDPFVGGLAEDAPGNRLFGDLFHRSLVSQFQRLMNGDRLFFTGFPFPAELASRYPRIGLIKQNRVRLADIIERTTGASKAEILRGRQSVFQL